MAKTLLQVESSQKRPRAPTKLDPCVMVIYGGTGDLARRKLIPALYNLSRDGALPPSFAVVGVSRSVASNDALRALHREATARFSRTPFDETAWASFAPLLESAPGDLNDPDTHARLRERLAAIDRSRGTAGNRIHYFATPASDFHALLARLQGAGQLYAAGANPWSRVVIEKPFGRDLASARELNALVARFLDERQVFRIDHYLGKETVQNILVFRFGNAIFEPLWSRKSIDRVEITAAESIGIEGRGRFYDETGVLRDIVQNHLLQVLACCAIESPVSFSADDVRDQKVQLFRSLRPIQREDVARHVVVGQFRGYRDEAGVARDSRTPTYAALRVFIDNWRWKGVPFYLRAGKHLAQRVTEIAVHFQDVPFCLFRSEQGCLMEPNVLTLRIQPDEGITLRFACKVPGEPLASAGVTMDFGYAQAFQRPVREAYERLLRDCMRGDATLFWRRDEVERAWDFVTPILEAIEGDPSFPLRTYEPGSQGPVEADLLLEGHRRKWRPLA